jgi:hypothetical protein
MPRCSSCQLPAGQKSQVLKLAATNACPAMSQLSLSAKRGSWCTFVHRTDNAWEKGNYLRLNVNYLDMITHENDKEGRCRAPLLGVSCWPIPHNHHCWNSRLKNSYMNLCVHAAMRSVNRILTYWHRVRRSITHAQLEYYLLIAFRVTVNVYQQTLIIR